MTSIQHVQLTLFLSCLALTTAGSAIAQDPQPRVAKDMATRLQKQDAKAPLFVEHHALLGRPVLAKPAPGDAAAGTAVAPEAERLGTVVDLVVDTQDGRVPFVVVELERGRRVAVAAHSGAWNATRDAWLVDATTADLAAREALDVEDLDALYEHDTLGPKKDSATNDGGAVGTTDAGATKSAAAPATPKPPARLWLATRLDDLPATARDGAFGEVDRLYVMPDQGRIAFVAIGTALQDDAGRALQVVPFEITALRVGDEHTPELRLDRDLATLQATPRLDAEDVSLTDPTFRSRIYRAVDLTAPVIDHGR